MSTFPTPLATRPILKPSQLNALAKDLLESHFNQIWLEGEISNLSRPSSGHLYFSMKDSHAQVRCAMFRSKALALKQPIKDGQLVLARAKVSLYEAKGDYQLIIESLEPAGAGALQLAYEQLKARLHAEGLFDSTRKKSLPRFIQRLGIITSPQGAAIHDVLSVLARRFPLLPVELWPVAVQGHESAAQIVKSLQAALQSQRYDAILITRGGGSLEDLWSFNDESLVRAVAAANVPIISAIGHEVDVSLLDFAADIRAATPSAAAELLSPSGDELTEQLRFIQRKMQRAMESRLTALAQKTDTALLRLHTYNPSQRLQHGRQTLTQVHLRLQYCLANRLNKAVEHVKNAGTQLNALSPLATLQRGYSIVRNQQQQIIHSVKQIQHGEVLNAMLSDGQIFVEVIHEPKH